jgi:hypothetical protein
VHLCVRAGARHDACDRGHDTRCVPDAEGKVTGGPAFNVFSAKSKQADRAMHDQPARRDEVDYWTFRAFTRAPSATLAGG